jgi:hypothetical protein
MGGILPKTFAPRLTPSSQAAERQSQPQLQLMAAESVKRRRDVHVVFASVALLGSVATRGTPQKHKRNRYCSVPKSFSGKGELRMFLRGWTIDTMIRQDTQTVLGAG